MTLQDIKIAIYIELKEEFALPIFQYLTDSFLLVDFNLKQLLGIVSDLICIFLLFELLKPNDFFVLACRILDVVYALIMISNYIYLRFLY